VPAAVVAQSERLGPRIAVVAPLSGRRADAGESVLLGSQLAVEHGRVSGEGVAAGIELVTFDDQDRADSAVANARRIIANPEILAVVGHLSTGTAVPASEIYKDASLAMLSPAATGTLVTDRALAGVSRVCGRHDVQGTVAAEFAATVLRARSAYVLHDRTTAAQDVAEFFRLEAERRGLRMLGVDGLDERADAEHAVVPLAGPAPDLVYWGGGAGQAAAILRRARERGSKARFLGSDALDASELARLAGRAAVGLHYTAMTAPATAWPRPHPFIEHFQQRFGRDPGVYAAEAYDATAITLRAIEGAIRGGAPGRESVATAIRRLRHAGVTGDIEFDGQGDRRRGPYFVFQVVAEEPERWPDNRLVKLLSAPPPRRP
jgi:branched-chain amino acid transport system substrate-binding protein